MSAPTITRAGLVRAAQLAIEDVRGDGVEVPTSLVREVMRVARTAEKITGRWFSHDRSCGCLVGTLHLADPGWSPRMTSEAEHEIGIRFVERLGDVLCDEGYPARVRDVLQVVE